MKHLKSNRRYQSKFHENEMKIIKLFIIKKHSRSNYKFYIILALILFL